MNPLARLGALVCIAPLIGACAGMSDGMTTAFVDPGRYDLYSCGQLAATRIGLAAREADLKALMEKAETGVAGSMVAEIAYRNDAIANRAQLQLANKVWIRNNCEAELAAAPKPQSGVPAPLPPEPTLPEKRGRKR